MTNDLFADFLHADAQGLRVDAKRAATALVNSVSTQDDKIAWTLANLERLQTNGASRIRHEIYEGIVFPALKARFECGDPEASYQLGRTWQNFISKPCFTEELGWYSAEDFYRIAYQKEPGSLRYERALLERLLEKLAYLFHEWPAGILIDHRQWRDEIISLREDIDFASSIDRSSDHAEALSEWAIMTDQYRDRLDKRDGSS
ncbi:hypothetical protein ACRAQ7_03105 [Erythrobacter sp. W53]|uniref:hypothetical protein n=1 Tax=Erythrobacter sp. W53 TaxID=3425947 RepID=UPI003D76812D